MKQLSLASGFELMGKRTRKRAFLEEMDRVVPWSELVRLIEPHYAGKASTGRPPFRREVMLRIHYLQQRFGLFQMIPKLSEELNRNLKSFNRWPSTFHLPAPLASFLPLQRIESLRPRHFLASIW